jgi:hypothetical protein
MVAFSPFAQDMLRAQAEKNEMENMENEVMDFFGKKKDKNQDYTFIYLVIIILAFVIFGKK